MSRTPTQAAFGLDPDLMTGVVPVSSAASQLAGLIHQAQTGRRPIAITQRGAPTAILLSLELFTWLTQQLEERAGEPAAPQSLPFTPVHEVNQ